MHMWLLDRIKCEHCIVVAICYGILISKYKLNYFTILNYSETVYFFCVASCSREIKAKQDKLWTPVHLYTTRSKYFFLSWIRVPFDIFLTFDKVIFINNNQWLWSLTCRFGRKWYSEWWMAVSFSFFISL